MNDRGQVVLGGGVYHGADGLSIAIPCQLFTSRYPNQTEGIRSRVLDAPTSTQRQGRLIGGDQRNDGSQQVEVFLPAGPTAADALGLTLWVGQAPFAIPFRRAKPALPARISQMPLFLMARYVHVFPVIRRVFGHFDRSTPWVTGENKHFVCSLM
ncbi:MAG: hypothetical protein V2A79_20140, partial [Planctomycetota bacterium]